MTTSLAKYSLLTLAFSCFYQSLSGQRVSNDAFDRKLHSLLSFTVRTIDVDAAKANDTSYIFLDTREKEEYDISHIPGAIYVGYKEMDLEALKQVPKNKPIVVYCSVGYRSEKIGEKLLRQGFTQVYNLYGSIFEWANKGYPLVDKSGHQTKRLHTYNRRWSKWVTNPDIIKEW